MLMYVALLPCLARQMFRNSAGNLLLRALIPRPSLAFAPPSSIEPKRSSPAFLTGTAVDLAVHVYTAWLLAVEYHRAFLRTEWRPGLRDNRGCMPGNPGGS